ncbi:unnamed protein product [Cylicocyclus nassatus]|uniref:Potassium channel domain-containing protein n=1 Tax=Cylicocyclus nassatus TaxID=53992 RepID=A0AA36MBZ8_CYLNA|nr:unnamed protein product [Cylicocyclus nassatus]
MLTVQKLRIKLFSEASTVGVHFALMLGVTVYTVFGALVMQWLESPKTVSAQTVKRDTAGKESDVFMRVYLGTEIAEMDPGVHECIKRVLGQIVDRTKCADYELEHLSINGIDDCYQNAKFNPASLNALSLKKAQKKGLTIEEEIAAELEKWSFGNALIFAFTVITTIGYGHVAPVTFYGRLFCIIYGLAGVPLALLTIADLGMFLTIVLKKVTASVYFCVHYSIKCLRRIRPSRSGGRVSVLSTARDLKVVDGEAEGEPEDAIEPRKTGEAVALAVTFSLYLILGALILAAYEPEMDFYKAFYFNFVTLTTIGLGDFVPKSFDYLYATLGYIGIGLALTTMAIDLAADLLRKLHYVGRKMDDMSNVVVWFGGKKMTMKNLVKNLGDQFNIPEGDMANFNLEQFVEAAMKVEAGEIKTLRKTVPLTTCDDGILSYSKLRKANESDIRYVDENFSKNRDPTQALNEDNTARTMETLTMECPPASHIPHLDLLDFPLNTDSSLPTSFDEDYMKTGRKTVAFE